MPQGSRYIKNTPKKIYLQIGEDENIEDFKDLCQVSWAADKIFKTDIEYRLAIPIKEESQDEWNKFFDDVDFELMMLEDYTHGEHGKRISELRRKLETYKRK